MFFFFKVKILFNFIILHLSILFLLFPKRHFTKKCLSFDVTTVELLFILVHSLLLSNIWDMIILSFFLSFNGVLQLFFRYLFRYFVSDFLYLLTGIGDFNFLFSFSFSLFLINRISLFFLLRLDEIYSFKGKTFFIFEINYIF